MNFFLKFEHFCQFIIKKIMSTAERLSYYIKNQVDSLPKFCEEYGIEYNGFTRILSGSRPIGINILHQVHAAFPNLNVHWVLYGDGAMEVNRDTLSSVNEEFEMYNKGKDTFETLLLKYLDRDSIKEKIKSILNESKK